MSIKIVQQSDAPPREDNVSRNSLFSRERLRVIRKARGPESLHALKSFRVGEVELTAPDIVGIWNNQVSDVSVSLKKNVIGVVSQVRSILSVVVLLQLLLLALLLLLLALPQLCLLPLFLFFKHILTAV